MPRLVRVPLGSGFWELGNDDAMELLALLRRRKPSARSAEEKLLLGINEYARGVTVNWTDEEMQQVYDALAHWPSDARPEFMSAELTNFYGALAAHVGAEPK